MKFLVVVLFLVHCAVFVNCNRITEQKSLVIVFDSTGSMFRHLDNMTSSAQDVTNYLANYKKDLIHNYILVNVFEKPFISLISKSKDEFLLKLKTIGVGFGGDCPEPILTGIIKGIAVAEPESFVFVFTDASAKDHYLNETVIKLVQEKQITITFYVTGICNDRLQDLDVYRVLASKSNGQVFYLVNGEVVPKLDNIFKNFVSKDLIHHVASPVAGNNVFDLHIDNATGSVTSTLAGGNPNITVYDPNNKPYNIVNSKTKKNSLDITIDHPMPGKWKFEYKSTSAHTVRVVGVGNLNFHYGFSKEIPSKLEDTIMTPLVADNVLSIFPTNSSLVRNLTEVIISAKTNKENNPEYALPLTKHITGGKAVFYYVKFKPFYKLFKILVCGFDIENFPVKRLLSTELTFHGALATNTSLPAITSKKSITIYEGEDFILACQVSSRTDVTIQWKLDNTILIEKSYPPGASELIYTIKNAKLSNYGDYFCKAKNSDGLKVEKTTLEVKKVQFEVSIPDTNYRIKLNDTVEIDCLLNIDHKFKIKWHFNNIAYIPWETGNEFNRKCILQNVQMASAGKYTCFIKVGNTIKSAYTTLTVLGTKIVEPIEIVTDYDKPLYINCTALGVSLPIIKWEFININQNSIRLDTTANQHFISKFKRADRGDYMCEIDNGYEVEIEIFSVTGRVYKPIIDTTYKNHITVNEGENVDLICACDNCYPVHKYSWSCKIGTITAQSPQIQNNMNAYRLDKLENFSNGTFAYKLTIKEINDEDGCECKLENAVGAASQIFHITVNTKPTVDWDDNNEKCMKQIEDADYLKISCKMYEGDFLTLDCNMQGNPEPYLIWKHKGLKIAEDETTIEVTSITKNDAGLYTCIGTNTVSSMNITYDVKVLYKPKIVETNYIYDGDKFIFKCSAIGYPMPTIEWNSNGRLLLSSSKIENNKSLKKSLNDYKKIYFDANNEGYLNNNYKMKGYIELNIRNNHNVTLSLYENTKIKSKRYECIASNDIGKNKKEITLYQVKPSFVNDFDYEYERYISNSNSFVLSCKSFGYPTPTVIWYKNNIKFDVDKHNDIYFSFNKQLLHFNKSDINDSGTYYCDVENWLGHSIRHFLVNVFAPPKVYGSKHQEILKNVNDKLEIYCAINGNPIPVYRWTTIDSHNNYKIIGNTQTLVIKQVKESCEYKCFASNFIGHNEIIYDVQVKQPPEFIYKRNETKTVKYNDEVILNCELAKGYEPFNFPQIAWFQDKDYLDGSDSNYEVSSNEQILTIKSNRYNTEYSCLIRNNLGIVKKYFKIIIET